MSALLHESGFYVWISSDTASDEFPENRANHFFTSYHSALDFKHTRWEVAIVEISYPHSWYNVDTEDRIIETFWLHSGITGDEYKERVFSISTGFYATPQILLDEINRNLPDNFSLEHIALSNKIKLTLPPRSSINFSSNLKFLLGFEKAEMNNSHTAERCIDMMINKNILYIYSNITKEIIVGHYFVPLLRTLVTSIDNHGDYVNESFKTPHYLPISTSRINHIEIEIRDGLGDLIDFKFGRVSIKLHFRQKTSLLAQTGF